MRVIVKEQYRIYATETCDGNMPLNTDWYDSEAGAKAEHYNLAEQVGDQCYFEYDGDPKNFISGDYELESEKLYFCPFCNEELDRREEECLSCDKKVERAH